VEWQAVPRNRVVAPDESRRTAECKAGSNETGIGLVIGGESNPTHIQVLSEGGESTLKLINGDGLERLIKP
jgi:hypothetical protein